ncbi:MAG: DUF3467 domain-containing protein [Crocinitomicaceae bacterium]|tara:strand:- start:2226 stop:2537 length:312 start_codon:yes stop_codon:yes gene_type:complete
MSKKQDENQMNIELSEEMSLGVYSNLAVITHSPSELVCDFIQMMPGMPKGKVRSRVIMNPQNAKRFLKALQDNMKKYEENFGTLEDPKTEIPPMNFGTPNTMA